jgi:hypothetical protein
MGASLVKYKGSSRQSFREVSETIPGLKSQVKRGVGDPERVVPGSLLANVNSQEEKSTDEGGPVRRSWPELVALKSAFPMHNQKSPLSLAQTVLHRPGFQAYQQLARHYVGSVLFSARHNRVA